MLLGLAIVWFVRYPLGQEGVLVLQGANVLAICVGTVVRFLAYSQWVFPTAFSPGVVPERELGVEPAAVAQPGPDHDPRPVTSLG